MRPRSSRTQLLITCSLISSLLISCILPVSQEPKSDIFYEPVKPTTLEVPDGRQKLPLHDNFRFDRIGIEEGLSQNTVFCILQDRRGFLWFGTEYGLNRYDGYDFTVYQSDPRKPNSLSDSWITSIAEDRDGFLWIGTLNGGLHRYDWKKDRFIRFQNNPNMPASLINNEVTSILEDSRGNLWIGTGEGLERYDSESGGFLHYTHDSTLEGSLSNSHVLSIYEDTRGVLWAGTHGGGLNRFDPALDIFVHIPPLPNGIQDLNQYNIRAITEDSSGRMWLGTDGGLWSLERDTNYSSFHPLTADQTHYEIRSLFLDGDGVLWIGSKGNGLFVFDRESEELHHYVSSPGNPRSLSSNAIESIHQDREGTIWIGTLPGGISKLTVDNRMFVHYQNEAYNPNSLNDNWVRSIFEDEDGVLWIATGTAGVNRYDPATGEWRHFIHDPQNPNSLSANFVSLIHKDRTGKFLFPTARGLDLFDPISEEFTHFRHDPTDPTSISSSDSVWLAFEDREGRIWIGSRDGGLDRFDPHTREFTHYRHIPNEPNSLIHDSVWNVYQDRYDFLWIGTTKGLDRFDPETKSFTHFLPDVDDPFSLSSGFIGPIVEDTSGILWIGTIGGGLHRFDRSNEIFKRYTTDDGLPSDVIMGIVPDERGVLWISTSDGLAKLDPLQETLTVYDRSDGLPFTEFNGGAAFRGKSGKMFFGGIGGFLEFEPENIRKNSHIPPVVITAFYHGDRDVLRETGNMDALRIEIQWPDNAFAFEFTTLSFTNPDLNRFAYKLEGLDDVWTDSGSIRVGRYPRLPGGTYTLRVIASNDDDVWNTEGATIEVIVIPPFWATWWFRIVAILLLASLAIGIYAMRVRNAAVKTRKLEGLVADRTAELEREIKQRLAAEEALHRAEMQGAVAAERGRLARDLHDSVTQSLYSLTLFLEATKELNRNGDTEQAGHGLDRSSDTALQALKEMRLLIYELKPQALSEMGLVGAIQDRLDAVERRAGVETNLVSEIETKVRIPDVIEEALFRISQEALNNALKHAHATSITVTIHYSAGDHAELEIVDNGSGFDTTNVDDHGGLGLQSIRERAKAIRAKCVIRSSPGNGTRIKIILEDS